MKKIYCLPLFVWISILPLFAAPEAEYGKLSETYALHADGSQEYRCALELTLFTHTAMNRTYGETFIVYNPRFQELRIHHSYTVQKDGTHIQTPPNAFVEVLPAQAAAAPAYNHLREMVIVHTGLDLDATIHLDYSILSRPGYLPELDIRHAIARTSPVKKYTLTLSVPEDKPLHYELTNHPARPTVHSAGGTKQAVWKIRNLKAASRAPEVSVWGGNVPVLTASTFASNRDALAFLQSQLTPAGNMPALSLAETITEGKETPEDKLFAVLNHVIDHVGDSRLTLSETGYRIRSLEEVNASAYATTAEKVNLLACLLNAAGIPAETGAAYLTHAGINTLGLSAVDELFVLAKAGGRQFVLTPRGKAPANAAWYAGHAPLLSVSDPGRPLDIEAPSAGLDFSYDISLSPGTAVIQTAGTVGEAFVPYTADSKAQVSDTTEQALKSNSGYVFLSLPDNPNSLAHAAYSHYNTQRKENLWLPRKSLERFSYRIRVPEGMELCTPETRKATDNAAGRAVYSLSQSGDVVVVERMLEIKKQQITPADYAAFRTLMVEWAELPPLLFRTDQGQ